MSSPSVLVVDDDEDALAIARGVLERAGYGVVTARNGREALQHLLAAHTLPAAVVLDVRMPVMDGRDVVRVIRSYSRLTSLPIIIHSAYAPDWECLRMAEAFVSKDQTQQSLATTVRSFARGTYPPVD